MAKPTFSDLMTTRGVSPARLAADARVSVATVYRARHGKPLVPLILASIAGVLGVSEAECLDAIKRSAKRAGRSA